MCFNAKEFKKDFLNENTMKGISLTVKPEQTNFIFSEETKKKLQPQVIATEKEDKTKYHIEKNIGKACQKRGNGRSAM